MFLGLILALILIIIVWYSVGLKKCEPGFSRQGLDCLADCGPNKKFGAFSCGRGRLKKAVKTFISRKKCNKKKPKGTKCSGGGLIWKACPKGYSAYLGACRQDCPPNTIANGEICKRKTMRKVKKGN